ncbi:MAG: Enoyl-[acyl-carrier-protein] reductase [NADH] FabI [Alphaproteobacteria bacterium MarineAlpha5_Bin9]|nr:MAG: Enoyl-[acyl-carrier-protein] reductase [NADH] FabI [Alphaproteobacteria bacterium MarineAlpha5_Bin9]|tara:strand:- start:16305 stop:17075 length:771 start_codon:yes stop_codon:yes gene_type:complete
MLSGKKGIVFGIANDHSIAWGIAKKLKENNASLIITYQNESLLRRVQPLSEKVDSEKLIKCDVSIEADLEKCFQEVGNHWDNIDFIVHSLAFSDKEELSGKYLITSKENFINTLNISCYSFTKIAFLASHYMKNGGSLTTLTFHGAKKVMPNYNVMGVAKAALEASVKYLSVDLGSNNIRVNAISASPMRTLSGAVIGNSRDVFNFTKNNSPLKRNVSLEEIGNTAVYLSSDMSKGVTGEIHYVDCGYNVIGMPKT